MNVMVLGKIHPSGLTLLRENSNFETVIVDPGDGNEIDKRIGDTAAILVRTSQISEALIARAVADGIALGRKEGLAMAEKARARAR